MIEQQLDMINARIDGRGETLLVTGLLVERPPDPVFELGCQALAPAEEAPPIHLSQTPYSNSRRVRCGPNEIRFGAMQFVKSIWAGIFPRAMPYDECFRRAKEAGFDGIELTM